MATTALEVATTALEVKKPNGSVAMTPMDLLQQAVSANLDIDKLQKLMDLQLTWEKNEARKAFVEAMNAFKTHPPAIIKNRKVEFGPGKAAYTYATLDAVCQAVTQGLSEHGISHRWEVKQMDEWIVVTCVLTHFQGHSEATTLQGKADTSGSKNSIQAIGSTVTYLQRYTLLAATGLAAGTQDNDGAGAPEEAPGLPDERFIELQDWIEGAADDEELKKSYQAAIKEAEAVNDAEAKRLFSQYKNKRYRELHNAGR